MICVSTGNISPESFIKLTSQYELVELRLDLLKSDNLSLIEKYFIHPEKIIITGRLNNVKNVKCIFEAVEKAETYKVNYIDCDINDLVVYNDNFGDILSIFPKKILSYHDFEKTPSSEEIDQIIMKMQSYNPDIYKLCFKAATMSDIIRTLMLYKKYPNIALSCFNLGNIGSLSRVMAAKLGAAINYVSIDNDTTTEESQISVDDFYELFGLLKL